MKEDGKLSVARFCRGRKIKDHIGNGNKKNDKGASIEGNAKKGMEWNKRWIRNE